MLLFCFISVDRNHFNCQRLEILNVSLESFSIINALLSDKTSISLVWLCLWDLPTGEQFQPLIATHMSESFPHFYMWLVYFDFFSQNPHMLVFHSPSAVKTMLYIRTNILQILLLFLLGISPLRCRFYNHLSWVKMCLGPSAFHVHFN